MPAARMHAVASASTCGGTSPTCPPIHARQSASLPPAAAMWIARCARCLAAGLHEGAVQPFRQRLTTQPVVNRLQTRPEAGNHVLPRRVVRR